MHSAAISASLPPSGRQAGGLAAIFCFAMDSARYRGLLLNLFYLALASVPLSVEWFFPRWHLGLTIVSEPLLVLTAGGLGLGLLAGWLRWPSRLTRLDLLLGLHFGTLLLASLLSTNRLASAKYYLSLVLYALVGYGLPRVLALSSREWRRAGGALALGTGLLVAYVLSRHLLLGFSFSLSYFIAQPFSVNGHTNLTVQLEPLLLGLSLLLGTGWAQLGRARWLAAAGLAATLMVVAFSFSRASFGSLLLQAGLLLAYTRWATAQRLLLMWAAALLVVAGTWGVLTHVHYNKSLHDTSFWQEMQTSQDFSPANDSNAERRSRWQLCWQLAHEFPLHGIGPGTFPDYYLDYVRRTPSHPIYLDTMQRMNAHNLYLNWLAEAGWPGLLTGLLLLTYPLAQLLREARRRPMPLLPLGLLAYFLSFLLHSLVQDFWQEPRVMVLFWLALGLQSHWVRANNPAPPLATGQPALAGRAR